MSIHDDAKRARLRLDKTPFLTLESQAGETIKFFMYSSEEDARAFDMWIVVEGVDGSSAKFLDLNLSERDMRQIIHVFEAKMFIWDEVLKPKLKLV